MSLSKTKILIVEDERSIAEMYRFKFEASDYMVCVAYDGEEGLVKFDSFSPDIILLDIRMPVMSGDEMLGKLRSTKKGTEVKVIILTNISKDEAPANLRLLNVDRYIVKAHHTPKQVVEIVEEILG